MARGQLDNFWYENNDFSQSEHAGTHTDAPAHFGKGKWRIDDIPFERLAGPVAVVDVREGSQIHSLS